MYSIIKTNEDFSKAIADLYTEITPNDGKISLIKFPQNMVIRKKHVCNVDFRSGKVAPTMILMALLILLSFGGNIWQFNRNSQLEDNELKYRYVKVQGKATQKNLLRFGTIFTYDRNRDSITVIRKKVKIMSNWLKSWQRKLNGQSLI